MRTSEINNIEELIKSIPNIREYYQDQLDEHKNKLVECTLQGETQAAIKHASIAEYLQEAVDFL